MKRMTPIILALVLSASAAGQNMLPNGGFENKLTGWPHHSMSDPLGLTGVRSTDVMAGLVSPALYAQFRTPLTKSKCSYVSSFFNLPAGDYYINFYCMWVRPKMTTLVPSGGDHVSVSLVDQQVRATATALPIAGGALVERVRVSQKVQIKQAGTYCVNVTMSRTMSGDTPCTIYVDHIEIMGSGPYILASGSVWPGHTADLSLMTRKSIGSPYLVASSFGLGPFTIGSLRIDLSVDPLFALTAGNRLPGTFVDYRGTIGQNGYGRARIRIPPLSILRGQKIHSAFVILDPSAPNGVRSASPTHTVTIE